jgi:hypothetical protein
VSGVPPDVIAAWIAEHLPTDPLHAWALGFLAGWDRADELAGHDGQPAPARIPIVRTLERAGRRRLWDLMVLAGEDPDPDEIERRLWTSF